MRIQPEGKVLDIIAISDFGALGEESDEVSSDCNKLLFILKESGDGILPKIQCSINYSCLFIPDT